MVSAHRSATNAFDTRDVTQHDITRYGCASSLVESGAEVVYRMEIDVASDVEAHILGDTDTIDNDVHIHVFPYPGPKRPGYLFIAGLDGFFEHQAHGSGLGAVDH